MFSIITNYQYFFILEVVFSLNQQKFPFIEDDEVKRVIIMKSKQDILNNKFDEL